MFGNSGICSCSHIEGMIAPIAAMQLHASVIQGRVRSHCGETSVHRAHRNTPMVITLTTTVEVISIAAVRSALPVTAFHRACTMAPPANWMPMNTRIKDRVCFMLILRYFDEMEFNAASAAALSCCSCAFNASTLSKRCSSRSRSTNDTRRRWPYRSSCNWKICVSNV